MKSKLLAASILGVLGISLAGAAPPGFRTNTCAVKVNGVRVGTDLTPGGSSLRNTFAYEPFTKLYHFWGFTADDPNFPSAASSLRAIVHATSRDGLHFTSDSNVSYAFGSASYMSFGASIDPPLDFFRAVFDTSTGTWKLFNWSENDQTSPSRWGKYNYNTSVNDLGSQATTTDVVHQGPLVSPAAGNHVGTFGLVDGLIYLRVDSGGGGDGQFAYTDTIPPSTGAQLGEADLFTNTPYCWFTQPSCTMGGLRTPAYVHNVGRTLRQTDGTLGTYYTFRDPTTSARLDKQIWYVESTNNGATWSLPAGVFTNGNAITIDGQPLDAAAGSANFSSVDVAQAQNVCRVYFSTQDAAGNYVMVSSTTGSACDALFADGFEGCGD